MANDLGTTAENTWCMGCGDFGILASAQKAVRMLEEKGISRENVLMTAGIGCFGKIFDYLNLGGLYGLHGRAHSNAQGMKVANPNLKLIVFVGDGDVLGEGLVHLIFAAKRNIDITVIMHDNGVYALTTGQFTPLSEKGWKGPSTPGGSIEEPLNACSLMLECGATFLAKAYSSRAAHLAELIVKAVEHPGFAFIDALQPCVSYHDTYKVINSKFKQMDKDVTDYAQAAKLCKEAASLPIGVFYKVKRNSYHDDLLQGHNPVTKRMPRAKRLAAIKKLTTM